MATKQTKSRISKSSAKKGGMKFHWWMAAILIIIVAVVGIAVLRFSRAGGKTTVTASDYGCPTSGLYPFPPTVTLSYGSTGIYPQNCVGYYQRLLGAYQEYNSTNFKRSIGTDIRIAPDNAISPTGALIFGPNTQILTIRFQKAWGLRQDGIVGQDTWIKLIKACYEQQLCPTMPLG